MGGRNSGVLHVRRGRQLAVALRRAAESPRCHWQLSSACRGRPVPRHAPDLTSEEAAAATPDAIQASLPSSVDEEAYEETEEGALALDVGYPDERPLVEDVFLPEEKSVSTWMCKKLLELYARCGALDQCRTYLASLPSYAPETERVARVRGYWASLCEMRTTGQDALRLTVPFWWCHEYCACVLCEAVSRIQVIPATFFLDSFRCSIVFLMHKEVCVAAGGFTSMMRQCFSGVGDPGSGKSHAADPFVSLAGEVCSERW